jgi:hypothetical protein
VREEPDCSQSLAHSIRGNGRVCRTYCFVSTKLDEGVKKGTNASEAGRHSCVLWISGDEDLDLTFEGLEDREHHFFKVRIQEVRLLLETVYLYKMETL